MNLELLIPLFALATWMSALYAENKFRYFYERRDARVMARTSKGLRRAIILLNRELKYVGLGLLWAGLSLGVVLSDGMQNALSIAAYVVGTVGLGIYVVSRLWPFLSK